MMAGYYPPEIMLLQVYPCQSSAGIMCWIANKRRVWIHTEAQGKLPRDGLA